MIEQLFWPIRALCDLIIHILAIFLKPFGVQLGNKKEAFDIFNPIGGENLKTWARRKVMSDSYYNKMKREKKYESFTPPRPPAISPPSISPPAISPPSISPSAFTPSPTVFTPSPSF